jgi:predicted PurR-regulated permease PerM
VNRLRPLTADQIAGSPLTESRAEKPPLVRRSELLAIALVGLLIIAILAVLSIAKAFFLPLVTALVVGTMLAPAAGYLERRRIPRVVSAFVIVGSACALVGLIVGLITAPLMDWIARLPELSTTLKDKMHVFDGPLRLWRQMQVMLGGSGEGTQFQLPKFEWMQPALEFLSPTFTEFVLFVVTLILFIASWPNLRRALVMNFANHEGRLRTLKILNEIEVSLGGYLLTVTGINLGVGIATGLICAASGMPNPAGLGALAATLNFFPIIGPVAMFLVLVAVGTISFPTLAAGMVGPIGFVLMTFIEGHFITPAIIGRRLELNALAVFIALAFWTWLWGPMGGFLAGPLLIVGLVLKEHLMPATGPNLPTS